MGGVAVGEKVGGPVYIRWITWIWQGEVTRVIAEVAARLAELGSLPEDAAETDPRKILADTRAYLTNQQSRMNDPAYRRLRLPITSSHIESTVQQISRRVKGSESAAADWTEQGGEALLQLRAGQLCDTAPSTPSGSNALAKPPAPETIDEPPKLPPQQIQALRYSC